MTPAVKVLNRARIRLLSKAVHEEREFGGLLEEIEERRADAQRYRDQALEMQHAIEHLGGELIDDANDPRLPAE